MAIFTNQAQLRYGNAVANSNVAVGEILEVLAATKTAVRKTYGQNDRVTYVVSIVNSGNTAMTGLTVADDLGGICIWHRHTGATDVCGRYRALLQQWNLTDNTGSHGRTTPFRFRDQCTGGGKRDHCI